MNINNYLIHKNEEVNSLIKKVNSDIKVVNSLMVIKKNYKQYGGAEPITIERINKEQLKFDTTNNTLIFDATKSKYVLPQGKIFLPKDIDNYKKYTDLQESLNLLVTRDDPIDVNKITSIEILEPLSNSTLLTTANILPSQLSNDNDLKFNLYKSLVYLDTQNNYIKRFDTLKTKIDTLATDLSGLRDKIKNKRTSTLQSFTNSYQKQVQLYLDKISETLKTNITDLNDIEKQVNELDALKTKITNLA